MNPNCGIGLKFDLEQKTTLGMNSYLIFSTYDACVRLFLTLFGSLVLFSFVGIIACEILHIMCMC